MPYESWGGHTRGWEASDSELYDLTAVCDRCGVPVARHRTDLHDQFHAQIDALMREVRKA